MLELIFRGFLEWVYVLLVEMWGFIADGLLSIMGLDFAYIQSHAPIIGQMEQILLAAGWALLLGNLVFQALKSMAAGLGFEGEDPRLLFARTFVFAFLLLASPQICRIGLDLTSSVMDLLSVPDAIDVQLVDESIFGALTAAWLMAMICSVIVMFKVLGLVVEIAERYVILFMLTLCAPLAFAMGGSKNTASIFSGWCRMFGSMCLLMVTNLVCFKMLFSVLSTVPSGLDVLPWMVLIFAIVKVAKKSDAIITRIGLNPAITGGPGKSLPGMLAFTVARTAVNQVAKGMAGGASGGKTAAASSGGAKAGGTRFNGSRFGGGRSSSQTSGSTSGGYTYQNSNQQNASSQSNSQQAAANHSSTQQSSAQQNNTRQENTSHANAQQSASGGTTVNNSARTNQGIRQGQQTRRSNVPPGTRRSRSYVPPSGGAGRTPGAPGGSTTPGQGGSSAPKQSNPVGTATSQSAYSSHKASHTVGGSTVHNAVQTSAQTNVTVDQGASPQQTPPATAPRTPHPGGPNTSGGDTPKQGKTRSTRRERVGAPPKTTVTPTPGTPQSGAAGKPSRSTQRPAGSTPRPGRNGSGSAAQPLAGRTASGPASQEQRKPATPAAPPVKGGAPTVRPGGAGTAPTLPHAASTKRPAGNPPKRVNRTRRPPPRKGGNSRGR